MTGCTRCGRPPEAHASPAPAPQAAPVLITGTGSRKARRPGRCLLGGDLVYRGQRITRVAGYGWVHARCVREHNSQSERPAETGRHSQQEG